MPNSFSTPIRSKRGTTRRLMAEKYAANTFSFDTPSRSSEPASDLAKTTHVEDIRDGSSWTLRDNSPTSSRDIPSNPENTSMPRPVPAAHLSFIRKLTTLPFSSHFITLQSCPPMSNTVLTLGPNIKLAPRAWQEISVIVFWAKGTLTRPYPVPTMYWILSKVNPSLPPRALFIVLTALLGLLDPVRVVAYAYICPSTWMAAWELTEPMSTPAVIISPSAQLISGLVQHSAFHLLFSSATLSSPIIL